ncbi:hypothetical protein PRK78_001119 [Emydomyces testavorans]|uniref:Uncharacterized protein n=1 Tax=Emydomyces testavorans TaxID=2070801 RepID=A0AAF0DDG6_9EURO|nr:hypothetical protein PRK78_001119 [Emydomyces testavorans]
MFIIVENNVSEEKIALKENVVLETLNLLAAAVKIAVINKLLDEHFEKKFKKASYDENDVKFHDEEIL